MTLNWPMRPTGLVLPQNQRLAEPEWSPLVESPTEAYGNYELEVTPESQTRFYRLTR